MFKKILLVAVLYFIAGKLALLLAIPPGYATAIWPAAGIALAFTVCYGYRMVLGVFIGSFLVNIGTSANAENATIIIHPVLLAMGIGFGASLQTAFGAWLIRKYIKFLGLIKPGDILKFMLLGGLVASLVSSTFGVVVLMLNNVIEVHNIYASWFTWWVGDAIGVFLFAPLLFLWIGEPRDVWKARRLYLIIPLILTFIIVVVVFHFGYVFEKKKIQDLFERRVYEFESALEYQIKGYDLILDSFYGFYMSSNFVDRNEFKKYAESILPDLPEVKTVGWMPKVTHQEKNKFINNVKKDNLPDFFIKDISPSGDLREASQRDVYYPLLYLEPSEGNEEVLGIDNGSEPKRFQSLMDALESGNISASAPLVLVQDQEKNLKSILLVRPVYTNDVIFGTSLERDQNLKGFLSITARVEDLVAKVFEGSGDLFDISFVIFDQEGRTSEIVFEHKVKSQIVKDDISKTITLDVGGRKWEVFFEPTVDFYSKLQTWNLWFVIVGVFLVVTFLNILFLIVTGQTIEIRRVVHEKTKELKNEIKKQEEVQKILNKRSQDLEDARTAALNIMEDAQEARLKAEKAEKAARKALGAKSEFTSMVSHELRTPLTVIKESVAIVYDGTAGEITDVQKDFLETAKRNVDRLGRLINDVLDYQKLEAQAMEFDMKRQDINEIAKEVGEGFKLTLQDQNIELEMKLAPELPVLNMDYDKITQVLINLINNAVKFTDKGKIVLMTEQCGKNAVKVSIKDSGVGIKPEDMNKLFKSFSQISTGMSRKTGGTGLGLALCKKIIEKHNGKIGADSIYGEGSSFYFILPVEDRRS